jgi:HK97 family phage portal protein
MLKSISSAARTLLKKQEMHNGSKSYFYSSGNAVWSDKDYYNLAENAYINNVIAHRAINMIAHAASSVPFKLYKLIDGKRHVITQHPILELLSKPNPMQSGKELLEAIYIYRQISGNAYLLTVDKSYKCNKSLDDCNPCNIVDYSLPQYELYCLRPDRVKVVAGDNFIPRGYHYTVDSKTTKYFIDQDSGVSPILHIKNFHPISDWYGLSSIEAAAYSIDQHNQASVWNQALLQNGGRPSGAIVVKDSEGKPANLTDEQFYRLKDMMTDIISGPQNAGRPLLLEGGLEWKEMSFSPKDMDHIESKNNSAREIAIAFGVPAQLLGIPGDNTYSNMSEARVVLWEQTILPLVENTLDHINRGIVSRFGSDLELQYDIDGISALSHRVDSIWNRMEKSSFITIDEKREAVGLSPSKSSNGKSNAKS